VSTIGKALAVVLATGIAMPASLMAEEQLSRLPRIGVLWPGPVDQWVKAFEEGLRENGYTHGATAMVYIRATGANYESGPRLASERIALNPDVIYAVPAALVRDVADAEQRAGKQIPIVLLTYDPRMAASNAQPSASAILKTS
jgi:ABC-type sugar transport system substrate-binding protein